jgi:hypothetical protein
MSTWIEKNNNNAHSFVKINNAYDKKFGMITAVIDGAAIIPLT